MQDAVGLAETFADHVIAGRIEEATALLAPVTQSLGGGVKLHDLWRQITTNYGKLVERTTMASLPVNGTMVVYFKFQFERGRLPGWAVCSGGKVESLVFTSPSQWNKFDILKAKTK